MDTCLLGDWCLNSCQMCTWLAECECVELICHPSSKDCVTAGDAEGKETSVQNQTLPPAKWARTLLLAGSRVGKWASAGNVLSGGTGVGGVCPWGGGSPYILWAGHIWGSHLAQVDGSLSSPGFNDSWCRKKWPCNGHSMLGKGKVKAALFRFSYFHWEPGPKSTFKWVISVYTLKKPVFWRRFKGLFADVWDFVSYLLWFKISY